MPGEFPVASGRQLGVGANYLLEGAILALTRFRVFSRCDASVATKSSFASPPCSSRRSERVQSSPRIRVKFGGTEVITRLAAEIDSFGALNQKNWFNFRSASRSASGRRF